MSARDGWTWAPPVLTGELDGDSLLHGAALLSLALLSTAWLAVLYHVADVVNSAAGFVPLVVLAGLVGAIVGRTIGGRTAAVVAVLLLGAGLGVYLLSVPPSFYDYLTPRQIVADQVSFLTGYSLLQMTNAGVWALAVAPGPLFLTAYFAARAEYVRATAVGSATLGFFVLTGNSAALGTMLGVLGATGAMGFGTLAGRGGRREQAETVAVAVAAMILGAAVVGVAPTVANTPVTPGGGGETTVEASLISADDRSRVAGSIRLSPAVRFTVEADDGRYWRVGAYDRYTGQGWVRTGGTDPLTGRLADPPGPRVRLEQRVSVVSSMEVLPAAAEPVSVDGTDAVVTALGTLRPAGTIDAGGNYTVVSQVQSAEAERLAEANGTYPEAIRERYLNTPESTPERVGDLAANVTANATTPYEKAAAVERYLQSEKGYSLDVQRPRGSVADAFLFEMERGYCVYFATTMATMLREEGVPARYVVGYTEGQRVSEDEWVVRGLDSHAWVEVYVPEYGWTRFDPTPASPRAAAERDALESARASGAENVDTNESENETFGTTTTADGANATNATESNTSTSVGETATTTPSGGANDTGAAPLDPRRATTTAGDAAGVEIRPPPLPVLAVWALFGAGVLVVVRRTGAADRLYRRAWLRYQPDGDPKAVVEGAYDRAEYVVERRRRPRRDTETVREYLDAVGADERVRRLARLREKARYGDGVSAEEAEEARRLVSELRRR